MIYLNKNGGAALQIQTSTYTANYTWWLGMTLSNCPATIYAPTNTRSLTLQGGIRSDKNVGMGQGGPTNLHILPNPVPGINGTNVSPIETIADRILWLEEQRTTP